MGKQRSTFAKLQRDKAKKERAAEREADRARRNAAKTGDEQVESVNPRELPVADLVAGDGEPSPDELLEITEELSRRLQSGLITEDEFEDAKLELFSRLA